VLRKLVSIFGAEDSNIRSRALAEMLRDNSIALHSTCLEWVSYEGRSNQAVFLANLCIAYNKWNLAAELLDRCTSSKAQNRAKARLLSSFGHMTDAIELLEKTRKGRQLWHYKSELASFKGLEPTVPLQSRVNGSTTSSRSSLYIATNSLPHTGS